MGIYIIRIPDIGEGIAEVELVDWHIKEGDAIQEDQLIADVMTDKATVEIPSPVSGTVLKLGGQTGDTMAVGAELIRLEVEGEGNQDAADAQASEPAAPAPSPAAPVPPPAQQSQAKASPTPAPVTAPAPAPATDPVPHRALKLRSSDERPLASPAVRRRALDLGVELRFVQGSGPAGRILHEDLDAFVADGGQIEGRAHAGYMRRNGEETIRVIGLRRKIAQQMQRSKRQIPHFAYVEEVDVTELEKLRQQLNARYAEQRGKLTLLPFLARAMVLALREFPHINARFDEEAGVVTRYEAVHLGIATQTHGGLMVPVLQHAEALDLWACAEGILRVSGAARSGKAAPGELSGSTITITSLGPLGGIASTPVINHPEVAIVGVNRMVTRPMFDDRGNVVARRLMNLSSSFDHRVVDGMDAAEFIQSVRARLETPALLLIQPE